MKYNCRRSSLLTYFLHYSVYIRLGAFRPRELYRLCAVVLGHWSVFVLDDVLGLLLLAEKRVDSSAHREVDLLVVVLDLLRELQLEVDVLDDLVAQQVFWRPFLVVEDEELVAQQQCRLPSVLRPRVQRLSLIGGREVFVRLGRGDVHSNFRSNTEQKCSFTAIEKAALKLIIFEVRQFYTLSFNIC
ncbi:Hypothetical_protein [Hexamita inflata]|uniref:Hypothetical_protein n=1 Tax=Hexamita inflata TaxID=28002 RepID=A0ABP1JT18_9EUKA